jgi:DNA-binding transcriptional LysR family regulator
MMLDRRMLHFLALAEELHFGRAADRLHITQPALSASVKNLELSLGLQLIRRNGRRIELTEYGRSLAERIRELHQMSVEAIELVKHQSAVKGAFRIGFAPTVDPWRVASLISGIHADNSLSRTVRFISVDAAMHIPMLEKGRLDASLILGPVNNRSVSAELLAREPLAVVYASAHCLATASVFRLGDLLERPSIWLRRDLEPYAFAYLVSQFKAHGASFQPILEVSNFEQCLDFAAAGVGWTVIPASLVAHRASIATARSDWEATATAVHLDIMLLHRKHDRSELLNYVRDTVRQTIAN